MSVMRLQRMQHRVCEHLTVAESIARRFEVGNTAGEDLRQVAYLGLTKASHRYDPGRGESFMVFAVPTIVGEVKKYLRDHGYVVRPPRNLQELRSRIAKTTERLAQSLQHDPSPRELAEALDVDPKEARVAAGISPWAVSLAELRDSEAGVAADDYERFELANALAQGFRVLSERRRWIVYLRFFQELTQQQIAQRVGLSQVHVSRLLASSLTEMRVEMVRRRSSEREQQL